MKITEALVAEHRIFRSVFDQIERVLPWLATVAEVKVLASVIEGMLEDHAGTETNLAYLALDHVMQDKGQLDRLHEEHQEIDASLRRVQQTDSCPEARRLLATAIAASRHHFHFEEQTVFPLLESVLQGGTLTELGATWSERSAMLLSAS
ncbi:MAG TPA: hemerythrin domain-containing protein [Opitutaceae bacterium]|nr:hemerythrin domain-containing protein [Opitutaceae bacterium]